MAQDRRKRTAKKTAAARRRRSAGTQAGGLIRSTLRDMKEGLRSPDPLDAELCASSLLGLWQQMTAELAQITPADEHRRLSESFVRDFGKVTGEVTRKDALALLTAMAAVAEPALAKVAGKEVVRMRAEGVAPPPWAEICGAPEFQGGWRMSDVWGDQDSLVLGFAYPGQAPHSVVALVDHTMNGIVKDVFVAEGVETILAEWEMFANATGDRELMRVEQMEARAAGQLLYRAIERHAITHEAPSTDTLDRCLQLVKRRAANLAGEPLPGIADGADEYVEPEMRDQILAEFLACDQARELHTLDGAADHLEHVAEAVIDYACDYCSNPPWRFSPGLAEICLLSWFPRKVTLPDEAVALVPPVVRAWAAFAGPRQGLPQRAIDETLRAVDEMAPHFAEEFQDADNFGWAKRLAGDMAASGVDPTDPEAVARWQAEFNERPQSEREAVLGAFPYA